MNIKLNHQKLAQGLQYASKAVSQKPNIPILSNVLLNVDDNGVNISATNLDMGISMWIPGQTESSGKATVHAKYIADFVQATLKQSEALTINLKDQQVFVQTDQSQADFSIIPADEFPVLPEAEDISLFSISSNEFLKSMNKVLFSCSTDLSTGRIQQSGVFFEIDHENNELHLVGLDGFRLSKRVTQITEVKEGGTQKELIVPGRYLQELVKILQDYGTDTIVKVYLSKSNAQIIFMFEDVQFSIGLLEGPYPEYKKIMPDGYSFRFEVEKKDLEHAIKVINTFARGNLGNKTLFDYDLETSTITLQSAVTDIGKGETHMTVANSEGESDLKSAYVLRFLQDVVNHVSGETLIFESKGPLAASVFKDKEDPQFIHLIMPMRRD